MSSLDKTAFYTDLQARFVYANRIKMIITILQGWAKKRSIH